MKDFATRLFLIGQFVSHLETVNNSQLEQLVAAGLSQDAVEQLRGLSLSDTIRFASACMGISVHIDCQQLVQHLRRVDRAKTDRQLFEAFVSRGASVKLVARLFTMAEADVRRARKLVAPGSSAGGRPKLPDDAVRDDVLVAWRRMKAEPMLGDRERWWALAGRFPELPIVSLEAIVGTA